MRSLISAVACVLALSAFWFNPWAASVAGQDESKPLTREQAKKLKNPGLYTKASVAKGKTVYLHHCQECHDADGKGLSNITTQAPDLTRPKSWLYGATDGEIFRTIRDGAGDEMPPFRTIIKKDEEVWHLVNFVHSLRPKPRPFVVAAPKTDSKADDTDKASLDPKKIKNPVPYTKASIAKGKTVYLHNCQECHDADGRALANVTSQAADLTDPASWLYGITDGEILKTLREGAGDEMPPFKGVIKKDEDMWHLVNFMRSIGPKSLKPVLREDKPKAEDPA